MEIHIKNFGKIEDAEISLSGLTLIAGPNDSGKSTVGKAVFASIKSLNNYSKYYDQIMNLRLYREYIRPLQMDSNLFRPIRSIQYNLFENEDDESVFTDKMRFIFSPQFLQTNQDQKIEILRELEDNLPSEKSNTRKEKRIQNVKEHIQKAIDFLKNDITEDEKLKYVSQKIYTDVFEGNINNSLHRKDKAEVALKEDGECMLSLSFEEDNIKKSSFNKDFHTFIDATFIDNPLILAKRFDRYGRDFYFFEENILQKINLEGDLLQKKNDAEEKINYENYHSELIKEFESVFKNASFMYSEKLNRLKYKVCNNAKEIEVSNIASGSKSFGLLYLLLKTGVLTRDNLIIFDEPENHLHPVWQLLFAHILCKMVKADFHILMTSHSPYMIQAIKTFSIKENIFEDFLNFYYVEESRKENYCFLKNVRNEDGNFDDEKIFRGLFSPFEELENLDASINDYGK